jgi:tRNA-Thr(GGU) m(6)t(6)A37 methyltransferase TsaA
MWVQIVVFAAFTAHAALQIAHRAALHARLRGKDEEVAALAQERRNERTGRIKAERELREAQLKQSQAGGGGGGEAAAAAAASLPVDLAQVAFPLRPIGLLRSCFSRRNGTPRQPLLVPAARAALTLRADLSPDFLQGLAGYSHCWVLYVFHENTDLQRLWQAGSGGVRAKIRVPRLNGGRLGVLATRSPHRPCPVGLSVAEIVGVQGSTLILGGADIVDGTPVLDIKPYVAFCDAVPGATAPHWVRPLRAMPCVQLRAAAHHLLFKLKHASPCANHCRWRPPRRTSRWPSSACACRRPPTRRSSGVGRGAGAPRCSPPTQPSGIWCCRRCRGTSGR